MPRPGGNGKHENDANAAPIYRFQEQEPLRAAAVPKPATPNPEREKTSPYEYYDVPMPPGRGLDWGNAVALLIFLLVFAAALGLGAYILLRPFLN